MTRNWTDYPLSRFIPIKKIHITELYQAYEERLRFLRADSNRTTTDFPLPVFYYDKPNAKLWGDDYPKADPAHWPPNDSPDNKVRNDHIYNIRYCVPGAISSTASDGAERPDRVSTLSHSFVGNFIKPDDAYYRPYDDENHTGFQPIVDALGQADYTDPTLTAGSVYVKADHVDEVRKMLEQLRVVWVNPTVWECRIKEVFVHSYDTDDAAWAAALTAFADADWSDWQSGGYNDNFLFVDLYKADGLWRANIIAREHRITFDLDLDSTGMGWSVMPPISAKMIMGGYCYARGNESAPTGETIDFYIKCTTTGTELALPRDELLDGSDPDIYQYQKGYVFDSDISSYLGSSQAFIFSTPNGFSESEVDSMRPDSTYGSTDMTATGWHFNRYVSIPQRYNPGPSNSSCRPEFNAVGMVHVQIEPNWHHGTEDE